MSLDVPQTGPACVQHPHVPAARACDRCGNPYCGDCLVPLRGQMLCGNCKHAALSGAFQSYQVIIPTRGAAPATPGPAAMPFPTTALNSPCALHEHQEAVAVCDRCGDFLCLLCLTPFEGRSYCLRCFELLWERGEIGRRQQRLRWHEDPALALVGAIMTWVTCFIPVVSLLPALGSAIIGSLALSRRGKELTGGQRGMAITSIVLAVIGSAVSIIIWVGIYTH